MAVPSPLTTKLYMPPPRANLISRPRLLRRLDEALQPGKRLLLVSAPAGYGKTTLVASWLSSTALPSAWLSLDESDNDPIRFLQGLTTALRRIVPTLHVDGVDLQALPGMPAPAGPVMSLLVNELAEQAAPFVLVLDDFHAIHAQPVLEMLAFLLEHTPAPMHLALLSRTDPPLPLARLRARDQLVELRAGQLRFTPDEVALFMNGAMGLSLSSGDVVAMEARTEGWIAGLQLAALSMRDCEDVHAFVSAFTGSHHYVMDYLVEEVLRLQPERVRSFLLQTSILDRLCGPLCDAVVEAGQVPVDGQAMLETLEGMNLFLIPLDGERRWYRYHHLFADVLNRHLEHRFPDRLSDLHRRAAQWHEHSEQIPEAIHHALLARDGGRSARLVEGNGCQLLMAGEVITLRKWIEAVEPYSRNRPWLDILKAWALTLTGHLDGVEQLLGAAERALSSLEPVAEVRIGLGSLAAARAHHANIQGDTRRAAGFARQALDCLPDDIPFSISIRSLATTILGDASWMNGALHEAGCAYREAVSMGQAAGNVHLVIMANSHLAGIQIEQGELHQAAGILSGTLSMAERPDGQQSPLAGQVYFWLSRVAYEWNQLGPAAQHLRRSLELSRRGGNTELQATGAAMLARLEHAQGHSEQAHEAMRTAERLAAEFPLQPRQAIRLRSALARLWMAYGHLEPASHLVQTSGLSPCDEIPYLREPEYVILLRLLLAQGNHDAAQSLSRRLLHQAEGAQRTGQVIELLVLQALALQGKQEGAGARAALERALMLAQPEGFMRVFLDEGKAVARLLHQARARQPGNAFVAGLLAALGAPGRPRPPAQPFVEPLSVRELEVLVQVAAGCSNQDIANLFVISVATVKRHISNIYGKLGVTSRTQAVSLGRELGLIE